ncbi:MAG: hypothetical protein LBB15_00980 [Puniceicoccales bacterium]|jgi:hypothetical protein|nr:hypothetical protein [Puniceicoccales bacterium]
MSIIRKAMQRKDENLQKPSPVVAFADIDKKTISGCYGIDNLFARKSRKLSFVEFCNGLKDIFLAIPIFTFKLISVAFDSVKRPICAFGIMCTAVVTFVVQAFTGEGGAEVGNSSIAESVVAVENFPAIGMKKTRIISDINGHISAAHARENSNSKGIVVPGASDGKKAITNVDRKKATRTFEAKLRNFFAEHAVSDVACANGRCQLKLRDGIFVEHSILCNHPKIVLESSTDDEIVFSDGAGTFCALTIESLLR